MAPSDYLEAVCEHLVENDWLNAIEWNFEKFLVNRDGEVVRRYPPATAPEDKGLMQDIADLL